MRFAAPFPRAAAPRPAAHAPRRVARATRHQPTRSGWHRASPRQPPVARPAAATAATDDWAAAASFDPADPDFSAFLDGLVTGFAKAALAGDERALAPGSDWHADVNDFGQAAAAGGALAAARFAYCLLECAGHRWPQAEVDGLEPPYNGAIEKVHALLEDSGWRLVRPGEEGSGTAGIDEAWE